MVRRLPIFLAIAARVWAGSAPPGFTPLFNGRDLIGWHVSRTDHHGSTPGISIDNGVLRLSQSPYGQGGLLLTDRRYRDFELYLEVKAPAGCNSGIFLRSSEGGSAFQIELDQGHGTGNLLGENLNLSRTAKADRLPAVWKENDWNSFRIRIEGAAPRISEWIDGWPMWDIQEPRNDKIAGETDGMIGLQVHWVSTYQPAPDSFQLPGSWKPGAAYQFRNIAIKVLHAIDIPMVLIHPGRMQEAVFEPACPAQTIDPPLAWSSADLALCHKLAQHDASPGFPVSIARPFYIAKFEITQAQWTSVMGYNPSVFPGDNHPVENVTWDDAQAFIQKLNRLENTHAYRLPTEFEWEYAGRAGGPGQIGWDAIRRQAVQGLRAAADGAAPTTQPVGSKQPNAWGLYDMLGNVWEWVHDFYNEKTFPDPIPPTQGAQHVLKGGGFVSDVKNVIYATHAAGPGDRWDVGFRIVKDVEQ